MGTLTKEAKYVLKDAEHGSAEELDFTITCNGQTQCVNPLGWLGLKKCGAKVEGRKRK